MSTHHDYIEWKRAAVAVHPDCSWKHKQILKGKAIASSAHDGRGRKFADFVRTGKFEDGTHNVGSGHVDTHLKEQVISEQTKTLVRKTYLGVVRGTTKTGQKANPININPSITIGKKRKI